MKTVDLNKVLEMLVNEEQNEAAGLLHEWFVERSKQIHEELMSEDNSLSQDIEDDQEAIESEEFYSEAEGDDAEEEAEGEETDADLEADSEELPADMDADMVGGEELPAEETIADTIEDLEAVMARLKAEFAEITGTDEEGEETPVVESMDDDQWDYEDRVKGDFDEFYAKAQASNGVFIDSDESDYYHFVVAIIPYSEDIPDVDGDEDEDEDGDDEGYNPGVDVVPNIEQIAASLGVDKGDAWAQAYASDGKALALISFEKSEDEMDESVVTESEDDFADLEESWTLEPVKDPNLNGGKEIGADGAKVAVNDKSPLPEHDADARVGGKAVEIHSDHHEGHEREAAPEVKARPLLKNQVKKATDGQTKVSKEGDKSAKLNSKDGFGSDSPKSPIGQATDLRGSDFKRK
jgi:hypothetical protein